MTSSMLAGERRWASARRGGMTVLGKVAVPKPINLPSQKLENHGLDPNVEIVPKGSLSWGSRPSSSTSNPWGSSAVSPNADGSTVSPRHPSGRPSSGGGLSRPSTGGSDRMHEPSASSTWGPNSRPSSASGVLTSNQSSLTSSRPLSAETRPGSSHLSRFAEPVFDNSAAWGHNGTADKLSMPSKANDFSLSSGDFPTLGSEKDNSAKSSEPHDHSPHVRPGSGSGRTAPSKERNEMPQADPKSGTVDTWTRDNSPHAERWQGDPQHYVNPNIPPQHFDAWRGPPMNAPPGVWYRGPPPAGPPYPPVPHGGFPMEPFPYYHHRPQIPSTLPNSQPGPPPGPGPRGHHPRNGDFYRPQMPDAFIRPGMPVRPGFYPGPVPYDGYYGPPPMGYNPNDRDIPFMGMPPGPHGPPVYNMCAPQNPSELSDAHFRGIPPEEPRGPYKVLRKRENERDSDLAEDNWEQNTSANSFHKNERGTDTRRMLGNQGYPSDSVIVHSPEGTHKSKPSNESWGKKSEVPEVSQDIPVNPKDSSLIQKIEGLNAKVRASDVRGDEQKNRLLVHPKDNSTIAFGSISDTRDLGSPRGINVSKSTTADASLYPRQAHHGVRNRVDHHSKGRSNNQDIDGWRKKPPIIGSEVAASVSSQNAGQATTFQVPDNYISAENPEAKNTGESLTPMVDTADGQAQRARMRELAKQRAIQLQKEEEERIREQKAKALAKLEELNRRTLAAADGTTQVAEKTETSVPDSKPTVPAMDDIKHEVPSSGLEANTQAVSQISENTTKNSQQEPVDQSLLLKQNVATATDAESKGAPLGNDGSLHRQKCASHRQKQSAQMVEGSIDKSTLSGTDVVVKNPGSNAIVPNQDSSLPNNPNILSESTQQRKRNNKSSKSKHKPDDASPPATVSSSSASRVDLSTESGKPESPQGDLKTSTVLVTESKDKVQSNMGQISSLPSEEAHGRVNNQFKPQHYRKMPRNPQANRSADRFHVGDAAVWAPVRAQNKEEHGVDHSQRTMQDGVTLPAKNINSGQTNLKNKRAEMERYVPKPVAKELAQQGSIQQSASPSSPEKIALEDTTDKEDLCSQPVNPVSVSVGSIVDSKNGDNKQNKQQVKPHGAWCQREQGFQQGAPLTTNVKKNYHKSLSQQHEPTNPVPTEPTNPVPTEPTNPVSTEPTMHEWDPSDGWYMPEYPPTEVAPVTSVMNNEGGVTGKGKRPAYNKGQRSTVKSHDAQVEKNFMQSTKSFEVDQTDRPASSKENRSSHWQPKPQGYRGGGQNVNSEVKRESSSDGRKYAPEEGVAEYNKNGRGAPYRKPASSRGGPHSPNQGIGNMEDEAPFASSGFRKYGGQNNRSGGQDDRRKHNQHNMNREKQRQNLHYEYQPVGPNNSTNLDAPAAAAADSSGNAGPRYKERNSGQSRRGGGNFYGRQ